MLASVNIFQQRSVHSCVDAANENPALAQVRLTPLPAPRLVPSRGQLPVLLSVPHSGRDYPQWLVEKSARGHSVLCTLEDPLVDRLVWRALDQGIGAVIADAPRAAVDCNRCEDEVDPALVPGAQTRRLTPKARGGLGIVPSRTQQHGLLWRGPISHGELEQRLDQAHRPYHRLIEQELALLVGRFGCALLLDCHSMPPPSRGIPPVVIGDCHGRSAARWISDDALHVARQAGYDARLNDPFAGGHIIDRHGAPHQGVHALQIEIDRRCYLTETGEPSEGFDDVAALFQRLATGLGNLLLSRQFPAAAE